MSLFPTPTPARILSMVLLFNLVAAGLATWVALSSPWLGLTLTAETAGGVAVLASTGPAAPVPAGARLLSLAAPAAATQVALNANDLLEEPDVVDTYAAMDGFFQRQERIAAVLAAPQVQLEWRTSDGLAATALVSPARRPMASLPVLFWFQLVVASTGCLIACWVWVLRPRDWGVRMFGVTGLMFPVFAFPAAIYSVRELALPGNLFFALSAMNHLGSFMFGASLVGIFLSHPRQLVAPRHLIWPFLLFGIWWLTDLFRIAPDLDWGNRYAVMTEMLLAMALAAAQWFRSRGSPLDRAALRWFILSILVGSGLFILSMVASVSLGWLPPLPQGYAFGFFLLIYVGIALGLRRYRLFDLDEWAYRILLWVGGAVMVIGLDAVLIAMLHLEPGPSMGIALLVCGCLYFPARQWLWQHVAHRPRLQLHELMPDVVDIAFKPSRLEQEAQWDALLRKLYDPLELTSEADPEAERAGLGNDGLSLSIPGHGGLAARTLRFPDRGGRLFSTKDAAFLEALGKLLDQAEASRDAHERGVNEERKRIARDMHDDVGARLLMLIHRAGSPELAGIARAAMTDLRTALGAMEAHPVPLADALADWRAEAAQRSEAAGVALIWSEPEALPERHIGSRQKSVLERALREGISNALKHAAASEIAIAVTLESGHLGLTVTDNGSAPPPEHWNEGRGLRGMRQRLAENSGEIAIATRPEGGTRLSLGLALGDAA